MHTKPDAYKNMNMNTDTFKKHVNTKKYIGTYAYIKKLTCECRCKNMFSTNTRKLMYTHIDVYANTQLCTHVLMQKII